MNRPMTIRTKVKFGRRQRSTEHNLRPESKRTGRIPRVTKLLALAHRFEQLLRDGVVKDYAELARLGHVTRARVTQIMNLLNLAPAIQEEILFLAPVQKGKDPVTERQLRALVDELDWRRQERCRRKLKAFPNG